MDRTSYFLCRFRIDDAEAFLIWYSNGSDGVFVDSDGTVPCFLTPDELIRFAETQDIPIESEEPALHNFDAVVDWLNGTRNGDVDSNHLLRVWNLLTDLSASVKGNFDEDQALTENTYEKLFQYASEPGNEGEWTDEEISMMRQTLVTGMDLFRRHVRMQSALKA